MDSHNSSNSEAKLPNAGPAAKADPVPPAIDEALVRRASASDDLVSMFAQRAKLVGVGVSIVEAEKIGESILGVMDGMSKPRALVESLKQRGADTLSPRLRVLVEPGIPCVDQIRDALGERADLLDYSGDKEQLFGADVGITGVKHAIAETGSLVCTSGQGRWRGLSLVPPVHFAVVRAEQIIPDLIDLGHGLSEDGMPSGCFLISGPSKTADIEGILITGVHGPGLVHVFVVTP